MSILHGNLHAQGKRFSIKGGTIGGRSNLPLASSEVFLALGDLDLRRCDLECGDGDLTDFDLLGDNAMCDGKDSGPDPDSKEYMTLFGSSPHSAVQSSAKSLATTSHSTTQVGLRKHKVIT